MALAALLTASVGAASAAANSDVVAPEGQGPSWWRSLAPQPVSGAVNGAAHWYVLVFLSPECPLANADLPVLNRLAGEFAAHGVQMIGVYSDPYLTTAALARHASEYAISFATIDDRGQRVKRFARASYTPEVVVFSAAGALIYRGQIDDRVTGFRDVRPEANQETLRRVLSAVCAGQSSPFTEVKGFGCTIPEPAK